jgi:dCMP deaminase
VTPDMDRVFMEIAKLVTKLSDEPSRKTSVVFITDDGSIIASGANRTVLGSEPLPERRERPLKYTFIEHAERVAIYAACRRGTPLIDSTAYLPWFPCADCSRALVEVGVGRVVVVEPYWTEERYQFRCSEAILREAGVEISFFKESQ